MARISGGNIIEGAVERGQLIQNPGVEYHVDKDSGSDSADGLNWDGALATIQEGVDRCVSVNHDRVYVRTADSAYVENVVVSQKDYVSIIGVGLGEWGRPDLSPAAGIGLFVDRSQGFHGENLYAFSADVDAAHINSEGWKLVNCKFQGASDGLLLKGLAASDSYGASQGLALGCGFEANGAAGIRFEHADSPSGIGAWGNRIIDCYFRDNTGVDLLSAVGASGGGAGIFLKMLVQDCQFMDDGAAHVYMDMDQGVAADLAANSALIIGNYFADDTLVAAQCAIGGQPKVFFVGNYDALGVVDGSAFND